MTLFACIIAYLLGSVPNGLLLCRAIWHIDIREYGSRNIGATNVYRKGFLAVYIAMLLVGTPFSMVLGGIAAILGHSASVFLRFKGGKGVATGLGVIAMLMPAVTGVVFLAWLVIVLVTRYVSLGSIVGAALVPVLAFFFGCPTEYTVFGVLAAVLVIVRHHTNITRLLNGTESKIKAGHR